MQHRQQTSAPSFKSNSLRNGLKIAQKMVDQSRKDCKSVNTKYLTLRDKLLATIEEINLNLERENKKLNCKLIEQGERHALRLKTCNEVQEKQFKLVLKLRNKSRQLLQDVEDREKKIKELTSSLEQAEHTRLKQEKCMNELKSRLADMVECTSIRTLEQVHARSTSDRAQQLCSSLEREGHHMRGEVQRLREENERVMVELKAVQFQLQKVESLSEQQQTSKLSHHVLSITQQNMELLQRVRSLRAVLESKEQRLESMKKETKMLRSTYKCSETRWKDKEKGYEATIGQLERKVKLLEGKMECIKTEYLERVREHEGSISGMKPHLDQQPIPHSSAGGGAKCVLPVRLSEEAMRLKQSTLELLQSATPFLTPTNHQTTRVKKE